MIKFIFSTSLICCLFAVSCKKNRISDETTTVEFYVYNMATNEPFEHVAVSIIQDDNRGKGDLESTVLAEGYTDKDGKFVHSWKAYETGAVSYFFTADIGALADSLGYDIEEFRTPSQSSLTIKKDKHTDLVYGLVPKAEYRREWVNMECFNESDILTAVVYSPIEEYAYQGDTNFAIGCIGSVDQTEEWNKKYMGQWVYHCTATKNGIDSSFIDSFYYEPGVKNVHRIEW